MNSQKLDYTLPEAAAIWSKKFSKKITVDDIIKFSIDTERSYFLPPMVVRDIVLTPALCLSTWVDAEVDSIFNAKTGAYEPENFSNFFGRLFVPAGILLNILSEGFAHIKSSSSMDENKWVVLTERVRITQEDLLITHSEKLKFECEFILNHSKIGGEK